MKIKVSFQPGEEWLVAGLKAFVRHLCPGVKVHEKEAHPPYKHVYITSKRLLKRPQIVAAQWKEQKEGTPL